MKRSTVDNDTSLNIFCDASAIQGRKTCFSCAGSVCVYKDKQIDYNYRISDKLTSSTAEIEAVRDGILFVIKYKDNFRRINLFSDSITAINGIKTRMRQYDMHGIGALKSTKDLYTIPSQLNIEMAILLIENNIKGLHLYHQKGHVTPDKQSLLSAAHTFAASNGNREFITEDFVKYISKWNNYVDKSTRTLLRQTDLSKINSIYPLVFTIEDKYYLHEVFHGILAEERSVFN